MSREAMDSTLGKLSVMVDTAKAACNKLSWVWSLTKLLLGRFYIGAREIAIHRLSVHVLYVLFGMHYSYILCSS